MIRFNSPPRRPSAPDGRLGSALTVDRIIASGQQSFERARTRAELLATVNDPRVCAPERVHIKRGGEVVATMPRVDGIDLDALLARKGPLRLGEVVFVGQQVCGALAEMHKWGIAHGDVSPANIMLTRGSVVLVDTVAGALPEERGTAGFASPERVSGATPEGDMYSVGKVLEALIEPAMSQAFMGWIEPLIDANPQRRPRAGAVAVGLGRCATPQVPVVPAQGIAEDMRAHAHVPRERTTAVKSSRPWRIRKRVGRAAVALGLGLLGIAAVAHIIPHHDAAVAGELPTPEPVVAQADAAEHSSAAPVYPVNPADPVNTPEEAAELLTSTRFAALSAGDPALLRSLVAPKSAAAGQVEAQALALESGRLRFEGLGADVVAVDRAAGNQGDANDNVEVEVTYEVSAHTVHQGEETTEVPEYSESAVLTLAKSGATWLVVQVLPHS